MTDDSITQAQKRLDQYEGFFQKYRTKTGRISAKIKEEVNNFTGDSELGVAAKISPREEPDRHRLVCIYTRDFNDKDGIARS